MNKLLKRKIHLGFFESFVLIILLIVIYFILNFMNYSKFINYIFATKNPYNLYVKQDISSFIFTKTIKNFIITFIWYCYLLFIYLCCKSTQVSKCIIEINVLMDINSMHIKYHVFNKIEKFFDIVFIPISYSFKFIKMLIPTLLKQIIQAISLGSIVLTLGTFASSKLTYISHIYTIYSFYTALMIPIIMYVIFLIEDKYKLTNILLSNKSNKKIDYLNNGINKLIYIESKQNKEGF